MSESQPRPSADREIVKVTRAQVIAAQGKIETDRRLGRETPDWVRRVAAAEPPPTG
jgi:hypothetical protein